MKKPIKAILCDLDGVITQTAKLHARAWKTLFDDFLHEQIKDQHAEYRSFDIASDYPQYIDGKPRLEGVRSYLKARGIKIPEGNPDDSQDTVSVHGLGKKKNQLFHSLLKEEGVEVITPSVKAIREWKSKGMKTAVVSSSKNCQPVLAAAGIANLFDIIVDGVVADENGLTGKPEPDTFLYAANELKVEPDQAAVAEDAGVGIEAAIKGGFGLAIGILKENNREILVQSKADVLVHNLEELMYTGSSLRYPQDFEKLEHACLCEHYIGKQLKKKKLVFFFDYDGTLTPIVAHPEDALLGKKVRDPLETLAEHSTVTIISGRDKDDVKKLVGLKNIYYTGSHGFEIEGPEGANLRRHEEGDRFIPAIQAVIVELRKALQDIPGVQIEPKKFAVAIHYRNVPKEHVNEVKHITTDLIEHHKDLETGKGKMVIEVRPSMEWDKGKAMHWIAAALKAKGPDFHHIYMGDDITDEDAFKVLPENGTGILVGPHGQPSYADYKIDETDEVPDLLKSFIKIIRKNERMETDI